MPLNPQKGCLAFMIVLTIAFGMGGCSQEKDALVDNDVASLRAKLKVRDEVVEVDYDDDTNEEGSSSSCRMKVLTWVAEVDAPVHADQKLQAVDIDIQGTTAAIGYNTAGESFLGGVQIVDIHDRLHPELISEGIFTTFEVNSVLLRGNTLYLGGSTIDDDGFARATVEKWNLSKKKQLGGRANRNYLQSYAVTDLTFASSEALFATSGADDGGVSALDAITLQIKTFQPIDDARGAAASLNNTLAVLRGTPATIFTVEDGSLSVLDQFVLDGGNIPFSKSTIETDSGFALVAVGDGGVQVVRLSDGEVLAQVDNPVLPDLDPLDAVANAASLEHGLVFVANGGAGVRVLCAEPSFDQLGSVEDASLEVVGTLRLGVQESVNGLAFKSQMLIAPSGIGGVRLITVDTL